MYKYKMGVSVNTEDVTKYFEKLINLQVMLMESYGKYIKVIGEFEKFTGKSVNEIIKEMFKPETLTKLVEKVPSEILGEFFAIIFEVMRLSQKTRDINKLTPDEKIEIGEKLIELSKRLKEFMEKVKSFEKEG